MVGYWESDVYAYITLSRLFVIMTSMGYWESDVYACITLSRLFVIMTSMRYWESDVYACITLSRLFVIMTSMGAIDFGVTLLCCLINWTRFVFSIFAVVYTCFHMSNSRHFFTIRLGLLDFFSPICSSTIIDLNSLTCLFTQKCLPFCFSVH